MIFGAESGVFGSQGTTGESGKVRCERVAGCDVAVSGRDVLCALGGQPLHGDFQRERRRRGDVRIADGIRRTDAACGGGFHKVPLKIRRMGDRT